jgi:hypothetical protein
MNETLIKIVHEGEDYVTVQYGNDEYIVSKEAGLVIRVLLSRIRKSKKALE